MKVYTYKNCSSCKKALKWLDANGIDYEELPIREVPPTTDELGKMLVHQGGELRKLFNTAGGDYRELDMKSRLPEMGADEAIELLSRRGNLVKRPFLLGKSVGLVGFRESDWAEKIL
ncbi:MAG: arsenate reductase family protein [Opitutales bacterium]